MAVTPILTHPLEPLTPEEIAAAVAIVRSGPASSEHMRFVMVKLHEPGPQVSLIREAGEMSNEVPREAFLLLLDKTRGAGKTYEAIVDLSAGELRSWQHIERAQPSLMFEEFFACEEAIKADAGFQAALAKRGITDLARVRIDPWSAGNYGQPEEQTRR